MAEADAGSTGEKRIIAFSVLCEHCHSEEWTAQTNESTIVLVIPGMAQTRDSTP